MQNISPCLWFDYKAEEAAKFYISVFKNSKITKTMYYGDAGPMPKGTALSVTFDLDGTEFIAMNGGPMFQFSPAISFFVKCATQAEIDGLWAKLSDGGTIQQCGWLQDKYGVSWQIVPNVLGEMLQDKNAKKSQSVMQAMMQMKKLEIADLKRAFEAA